MNEPVSVSVPHQLGAAEAKKRIAGGFDRIVGFIPGARVRDPAWNGNTLNCRIAALGQNIGCRMEITDDAVHATFDLPPLLASFARKLRGKVLKEAPKLLR